MTFKNILFYSVFIFLLTFNFSGSSQAREKFLDIQEVKSPGGLTAWLIEDHSLPIIAMRFSFLESGTARDPKDKQGLVRLLSNTMDEGAGDLNATAFQKALSDHSITLSFSAGRDSYSGTLKTLSHHQDKAFDLLTLALTQPRFDNEAVDRMREANLARIRSSLTQPEWVAARILNDRAYTGHPYAMNSGGTLSSLTQITPEDLHQYSAAYLTKDQLYISIAGDITADSVGPLLDKIFGKLPDHAPNKPITDTTLQHSGATYIYEKDIPQTIINMAMPGIDHNDPDYHAYQVMNYIFGSGGFGSRLMESAREKQGLTYGIYSSILNYEHIDTLTLVTSTKNESATTMLDLIHKEMNQLRLQPVSDQELQDAKSYLTGSLALSLSSTGALANIALGLQVNQRPIDYLDHYADYINALTVADIARVAKRTLNPDQLLTVLVGKPAPIENSEIITDLPNVE